MKRLVTFTISIFCLGTLLIGQSYSLDTKQSKMNWTGKAAFNTFALSGTLEAKSGQLQIEDKEVTSATVIVDMKTLDAENKNLKSHLRNEDFFDVKKYPRAYFEIAESFTLKKGKQMIKGYFTIKEEKMILDVEIEMFKRKKEWILHGLLFFDRTAFGINYNDPKDPAMKDNDYAIAREVELDWHLVFKR